MSDKTANERRTIRLSWAGEIAGYYRTYYKDEATGEVFALTNFRSVRTWHTAVCNGGEPDMPLKDGLLIEIVADGRVISREVISRVDDCTSIGLPVLVPPATPYKQRGSNGKKAHVENPSHTKAELDAPGQTD
jgi:hypothetical protein